MRLFLSSLTGLNYVNSMKNVIDISEGDNIASKLSGLTENTLIRFLPGLHEQAPEMNSGKDLVYIDKSNVGVQIMGGSHLKIPDNTILIDRVGELAPNQAVVMTDFEYRGTYTGPEYVDAAFWIKIDGVGTPNTFKWANQEGFGEPSYPNQNVPITGDWQTLSDSVEIKITTTTGHVIGEGQIISFGAKDQMCIRVGSGFHTDYIENVNIFGNGVLDWNIENNARPTAHAIQLPSGVLLHGRLSNCGVYDIKIQNSRRGVMAYGDSDGTYNSGGSVTGGTEYAMYNTTIANVRVYNPLSGHGAGLLLGHPEHRGSSYNLRAIGNHIDVDLNAIECNFMLKQYQVYGNMMKVVTKDVGIHLWRKSEDGMIINNTLFGSTAGKECLSTASSPVGWGNAVNIYRETNLNLNDSIGN